VAMRANRIPRKRDKGVRKKRLWKTEAELQQLIKGLEQPPLPSRIPALTGDPSADDPENVEAWVAKMVPTPERGAALEFDPHVDDPLTKGMDIMTHRSNHILSTICCSGCGIPLQTHDADSVGYVPLSRYLQKWAKKQHRRLKCTRCMNMLKGELAPVVRETMGPGKWVAQNVEPISESPTQEEPSYSSDWDRTSDGSNWDQTSTWDATPWSGDEYDPYHAEGFGKSVVPAKVLERQLMTIKQRQCLVVYIIDILDFNGSFVKRFRKIVGRNPIIVIATKLDLLPEGTDIEAMQEWVKNVLRGQGLKVLDSALVSSFTGKNLSHATNLIIQARKSKDVFVVGAANAGKSMFITRLLEQLEIRYPEGGIERCEVPVISQTPGTTLGMIPLRAFKRSANSSVYAHLYDTPGVHQPFSMQNLLPVAAYNKVQPTRKFDVKTRRPARDVLAAMTGGGQKSVSGAKLQLTLTEEPIIYVWGIPGEKPVAAVEVCAPVLTSVQLSFVGVAALEVQEATEVPEHMRLSRLEQVKAPEELTVEGEVVADLCISGLGWVAVSFSAMSKTAAGRGTSKSASMFRIHGPDGLKVKVSQFPVPVDGLPGVIRRQGSTPDSDPAERQYTPRVNVREPALVAEEEPPPEDELLREDEPPPEDEHPREDKPPRDNRPNGEDESSGYWGEWDDEFARPDVKPKTAEEIAAEELKAHEAWQKFRGTVSSLKGRRSSEGW